MNEERQLTDAITELSQVLGLSDKDFKAAVVKMLQQIIANSPETNHKQKITMKK